MTPASAAGAPAGGHGGPAWAHAVARHRGIEIDVSARPGSDPAHSRLVILLHDGVATDPRVVEYVIDDGDPRAALDAGLALAREAVETASRQPR